MNARQYEYRRRCRRYDIARASVDGRYEVRNDHESRKLTGRPGSKLVEIRAERVEAPRLLMLEIVYIPKRTPAEMIAEDIKRLKLTQKDLAEKMEIDAAVVSRLITGSQSITPDMAEKLGAATGREGQQYFLAQCRIWWAQRRRVQIKTKKQEPKKRREKR